MSDCCNVNHETSKNAPSADYCATVNAPDDNCCRVSVEQAAVGTCSSCGQKGKNIDLITVKSMLLPEALATLDANQSYRFCDSEECQIVYFGNDGAKYTTADIRVPVFQKDDGSNVNACYCFGWSRNKIAEELRNTSQSTAVTSISAHIKAGRCACEVNNPQGSCCLGNVTGAVKQAKQAVQV